MPSIEQLDWSKLKPTKPDQTHYNKEKPKGYKKYDNNFIKPTKPVKKYKKIKAIDKSIWSDNYRNMEHLSAIMRET
jgi:hypothetical protein